MSCYPFNQYTLIGFNKGPKGKKYTAVLQHNKTKKQVGVSFGAIGYEQYKDRIGDYAHLDHHDKKRRASYRARHKHDRLNCFSPGYFSYFYLW
jgi:hypothetical protein